METGVLLREKLDNVLPYNDYFEYYGRFVDDALRLSVVALVVHRRIRPAETHDAATLIPWCVGMCVWCVFPGPDYRLHIGKSNMPNANSTDYLNSMCHKIFGQLDEIEPVPGVQLQTGQGGGSVPAKPLPLPKKPAKAVGS